MKPRCCLPACNVSILLFFCLKAWQRRRRLELHKCINVWPVVQFRVAATWAAVSTACLPPILARCWCTESIIDPSFIQRAVVVVIVRGGVEGNLSPCTVGLFTYVNAMPGSTALSDDGNQVQIFQAQSTRCTIVFGVLHLMSNPTLIYLFVRHHPERKRDPIARGLVGWINVQKFLSAVVHTV